MPKYITKQRKMLIEFFNEHTDEPVSASLIASKLKPKGISVSAIYRNLSALEKDGQLQRVTKRDSHEIYYRYNGCEECRDCLHLSCKKCGKTFHLNHSGADRIVSALSDTEGFSLDKSETILYGVCGSCKGEEK